MNITKTIKKAAELYRVPDGEVQVYIHTNEPKVYHILGDEILAQDKNYLHIADNKKRRFEIINNNMIKKIIITNEK